MPAAPSACVVMPTHGRAHLLEPVLLPVLADPATAEVVVVVDGHDAAAESALAALAEDHPRLRWLVLEPSVGTARAKLAGARAARSEVLVLLDDDVCPSPDLVTRHLAHHQQEQSLVVVGAMPLEPAPAGSRLDGLAAQVYRRHYAETVETYLEDASEVLQGLWGGNLSIRRADYLALEDAILAYPRLAHEDLHFGLSAHAAGLRGRFDPAASAEHLHRRSWSAMLREAERQGRGQRGLHRLHDRGSFAPDALPEPLHPLVAVVVLHSDPPPVRAALLTTLRVVTSLCLALGRPSVAVRFAFAATQIARRVGRRDARVDAMLGALSPATGQPAPR